MQDNRLLPSEYAWLQAMFNNIPTRQSELAEIGDFSKAIAQLTTLLEELLADRVIRPEHRTDLARTLRSERSQLEATGGDTEAEVATITAFLKRLFQIDWETIAGSEEPYASDKLWGNFRLTETEIWLALSNGGREGMYVAEYSSLVAGSVVSIILQGFSVARVFTLELLRVRTSVACLLFEARILNTLSKEIHEGFGVLLPGGKAVFMDSSPDSNHVHKHIAAAQGEI